MSKGNGKRGGAVSAIAVALALYAVWTFATWLLEGRVETLLRPAAAADRAIYAIVANVLIGIAAGVAVLRLLIVRGVLAREAAGFGPATPRPMRIAVALVLGSALYWVQGAPSLDPVVLANAFSQVLVVSAAEVVVCWAAVGATVEAWLKRRGRAVSAIGAALAASVFFGVYHYAHSPPFNTLSMVALLSIAGLATSVFFLAARDVYATVLFHNFLAVFGVVKTLAASGELDAFAAPQPPIMLMAVTTIAVLALSDRLLLRSIPRQRWTEEQS